jgi:hypothetical protein
MNKIELNNQSFAIKRKKTAYKAYISGLIFTVSIVLSPFVIYYFYRGSYLSLITSFVIIMSGLKFVKLKLHFEKVYKDIIKTKFLNGFFHKDDTLFIDVFIINEPKLQKIAIHDFSITRNEFEEEFNENHPERESVLGFQMYTNQFRYYLTDNETGESYVIPDDSIRRVVNLLKHYAREVNILPPQDNEKEEDS